MKENPSSGLAMTNGPALAVGGVSGVQSDLDPRAILLMKREDFLAICLEAAFIAD